MAKQKIYTIIVLYIAPVFGFFVVLFMGASMFNLPLVLAVVLACFFAIYEFFIMKRILNRMDRES